MGKRKKRKRRRWPFKIGQPADEVRVVAAKTGRQWIKPPDVNPGAVDEQGRVFPAQVELCTWHYPDCSVTMARSRGVTSDGFFAYILPPPSPIADPEKRELIKLQVDDAGIITQLRYDSPLLDTMALDTMAGIEIGERLADVHLMLIEKGYNSFGAELCFRVIGVKAAEQHRED